ncbi:MAG: hypothetical protein LBQ31_01535 [Bacteroidales bacterium]|nr:hypothetical protein [Bacteroidales bacterium]
MKITVKILLILHSCPIQNLLYIVYFQRDILSLLLYNTVFDQYSNYGISSFKI